MSDVITLLPYETPKSQKKAAFELAKIVGIPREIVPKNADYNEVTSALAGLVLFRHVERHQKREIMKKIDQFKESNRPFYGQLQGKVANVIANPRWSNWSLTTEELEDIVSFHGKVAYLDSKFGINPGAFGVGASAWQIIKEITKKGVKGVSKGSVGGLVLSIVLFGVTQASAETRQNALNEIKRRQRTVSINPDSPMN